MSWTYRNLNIAFTGVPNNFTGRPQTAVVSSDTAGKYLLAVYGRLDDGQIVIASWDGMDFKKWSIETPTADTALPLAFGDPSLTETAAGRHLLYRTRDSHLVEVVQNGGAPNVIDITATTATPTAASDPKVLHQIVWPGNVETLFVHFRGQGGAIHEISASPGGAWTSLPLFGVAYPVATGEIANLRGTTTPAGGVRRSVYFRSADGHIHELEHDDAGWTHRDLTALTSSTPGASSPQAYFEPTDDTKKHIVYIGTDSKIHELWCRYDGKNNWHHHNLSSATSAPDAYIELGLSGYWQDLTQTQHVIYCDVNGGVHELWIAPGKNWRHSDLSKKTKTPGYQFVSIKSRSQPFGSALAPNDTVLKQHVCFRDTISNDITLFYEWDEPPSKPDIDPGTSPPDWAPAGGDFDGEDEEKVTVWSTE